MGEDEKGWDMSKEKPLVVSDEQLITLLKDANKKLSEHAKLLTKQRDELLASIANVEKVKGRYHTEIAWKRLSELAKSIASVKGQQ